MATELDYIVMALNDDPIGWEYVHNRYADLQAGTTAVERYRDNQAKVEAKQRSEPVAVPAFDAHPERRAGKIAFYQKLREGGL